MDKAIVIGIAALLLGLVVSMPVRANALENTVEKGNVVEGEITQPREGLLSALALGIPVGLLGALLGLGAGIIVMLALCALLLVEFLGLLLGL